MIIRILILMAALVFSACKTTKAAVPDESSEATETTSSQTNRERAGAFEVAEAWMSSPGDGPASDVLKRLAAPGIERMHASGTDRYIVLVTGNDADADGDADAVLLTIDDRDGEWRVTSAEPARADYLWPTQ